MESTREYLLRLMSEMKTERSSWIRYWRDLNDYVKPRAGRFFVTDVDRGIPKNDRIINNCATLALRVLASGMLSGLTSPARPWFNLATMDPEINDKKVVKVWLETVRQRMSGVFLRSNIYTVLSQTYGDLGLFGTHAFALLDDDETVIRAYPYPVGSYMLATSDRGVVDTCIREFMMVEGHGHRHLPQGQHRRPVPRGPGHHRCLRLEHPGRPVPGLSRPSSMVRTGRSPRPTRWVRSSSAQAISTRRFQVAPAAPTSR